MTIDSKFNLNGTIVVILYHMNFEHTDDKFHYDDKINDKIEFSDAMFSVAINESELDDIISESEQIIIKQDFTCYCFNVKREPLYYRIKGIGQKLTNRYIINELIEQKMNLECNHMFLEGFIKKTDVQFELLVTS